MAELLLISVVLLAIPATYFVHKFRQTTIRITKIEDKLKLKKAKGRWKNF